MEDLRAWALTGATILAGALIFMSLAIVNGSPWVFWDTALYFALGKLTTAADPAAVIVALQNDPTLVESAVGAAERQELLDRAASHLGLRTVAYSLYMDLVAGGLSMWAAAFGQCLLVSASLWASLRLIWGEAVKPWKFLVLAAALSAITPVSIAGPLLMPDIFAAPMILLVAVLFAATDKIDKRALAAIAVVLVLCMIVHMSHLVIAFVMGVGAAGVVFLHKRKLAPLATPAATLAAAFVGALVVNASLSGIAESRIGRELHRPPHLAARIIDDGPGRDYIVENCPEAPYAFCDWAERILTAPIMGADSMIWKRDPAEGAVYLIEPLSVGAELREDEVPFILAVIADRPFDVIAASTMNIFELFRSFRPDGSQWYETGSVLTFAYTEYATAARQLGLNEVVANLPNREWCEAHPVEKCGRVPIVKLKLIHYLTVLLAALVTLAAGVGFLMRHGLRPPRMDRIELFVVLVIGGIVSNTVVCAVIGGVFDRYQSRVIWMLPMLAIALAMFSFDKLPLRSLKGGRASPASAE